MPTVALSPWRNQPFSRSSYTSVSADGSAKRKRAVQVYFAHPTRSLAFEIIRIFHQITCNFFGERGGVAAPLSKKITGYLMKDP